MRFWTSFTILLKQVATCAGFAQLGFVDEFNAILQKVFCFLGFLINDIFDGDDPVTLPWLVFDGDGGNIL